MVVPEDPGSWRAGGSIALERAAPAAAAGRRALLAAAPSGLTPDVLAGIRAACAATIGLGPLRGAPRSVPPIDPRVALFAEQFSADVSAIDDPARAGLGAALGDATFTAVQAIYVADQMPRVASVLDALFGAEPWPACEPTEVADLWPLVDAFILEVARVQVLDPVLTELVRLRGARQHNCRLCRSRRSVSAIRGGADERTFDAIDDYDRSDLPPRTKAALALTDAVIWQPANVGAATVERVQAHLTAAEAVEVVLDVVRNASNKIAVALGADAPVVTEGVELFDMDPDGTLTYGV